MAVRKSVFLNGLAQMGNTVVHTIEQLLLVPFFLMYWGASYYGEWLTISIIPTILAYSDVGFATAISNKFVLLYSDNDKQGASDVYKTGLIVITFLIFLGATLCLIALLGLWNSNFIERIKIPHYQVVISIMFLMCSRLISFYYQFFSGVFRAKHKADVAYNLSSIYGILKIVVGLVTLFVGCGIVGFSLCQLIVTFFFNLFFALFSLRQIIDLPMGRWNKDIAVGSLKIGFGYFLTPVWQSIYMQGTTFVVRLVLGPAAVAVFNTVRTVCNSVHTGFSIVYKSTAPELQIAYGKKDMTTVRKLFVFTIQTVFVISIVGFIILSLFGQQLYTWWTHNELKTTTVVWLIFMISAPLNSLWWTAGSVFRTINKPMVFSFCGLIASIFATSMCFFVTREWYLEGAAIGYVLMDILMLPMLLPLVLKELNIKITELLDFTNLTNEVRRVFKI